MKNIILLTVAVLVAAPTFAFQTGMSAKATDTEVRERVAKGERLDPLAIAAKGGNVPVDIITPSLILSGFPCSAVVGSLVAAGYSAPAVISSAVGCGNREALVQAAIGAGADPTSLLSSTASGGESAAAAQPSATGLNASSFGQSRAATVGGGGRSSVSRS